MGRLPDQLHEFWYSQWLEMQLIFYTALFERWLLVNWQYHFNYACSVCPFISEFQSLTGTKATPARVKLLWEMFAEIGRLWLVGIVQVLDTGFD